MQSSLQELKVRNEKEKADLDYWQFQFNQLEEAGLKEEEQEELEVELERLTHAEEIKNAFTGVQQLLDNERFSVIQNLKSSHKILDAISQYMIEVPALAERLESCMIELKDILDETDRLSGEVEFDGARIELVNDRLNLIYSLQQKHQVNTVHDLIQLKNMFEEKILQVSGHEDNIKQLESELDEKRIHLSKTADLLTDARKKSFSQIEKAVVGDLRQLGMAKTKVKVEHEPLPDFTPDGRDAVSILFSANTDTAPAEISKIASGGEMSRLMLSVKNLLRTSKALPTVVFDEIDAGISGETALQMGNILKEFATTTQIINITHLPQIAAKGNVHFRVYKYEQNGRTFTSVRQLNEAERIEELAKMVGGESLTETTLKTARELLEN